MPTGRLKLPNPTYYLPVAEPAGRQRAAACAAHPLHHEAGRVERADPEWRGHPNIDVVKKTIAAYYGDTGTGIVQQGVLALHLGDHPARSTSAAGSCSSSAARRQRTGGNPAIVLDADDTTLWTYDMEVAAMHFVFDPTVQDQQWVQPQRFPATPGMVSFANARSRRRLHAWSG